MDRSEKKRLSKSWKRILWGVLILVVTSMLFFGIQWATYARPPLGEAVEALCIATLW